jgi:hypothetical protein
VNRWTWRRWWLGRARSLPLSTRILKKTATRVEARLTVSQPIILPYSRYLGPCVRGNDMQREAREDMHEAARLATAVNMQLIDDHCINNLHTLTILLHAGRRQTLLHNTHELCDKALGLLSLFAGSVALLQRRDVGVKLANAVDTADIIEVKLKDCELGQSALVPTPVTGRAPSPPSRVRQPPRQDRLGCVCARTGPGPTGQVRRSHNCGGQYALRDPPYVLVPLSWLPWRALRMSANVSMRFTAG